MQYVNNEERKSRLRQFTALYTITIVLLVSLLLAFLLPPKYLARQQVPEINQPNNKTNELEAIRTGWIVLNEKFEAGKNLIDETDRLKESSEFIDDIILAEQAYLKRIDSLMVVNKNNSHTRDILAGYRNLAQPTKQDIPGGGFISYTLTQMATLQSKVKEQNLQIEQLKSQPNTVREKASFSATAQKKPVMK